MEEAGTQMEKVKKPVSGMAIAALVVGLVGISGSLIPILNNLSFIIALVGIVLGIVALVGIGKGKKGGKGLAVAGIVVSVLAVILVLASQAFYGRAVDQASQELQQSMDVATGAATDEILGRDVNVELGVLQMEMSEYGMVNSSMPATVTNLTQEQHSFSIQVEAVGPDGNRIDDDYIYVNSLEAGQSQSFEIFKYIPSENFDAMLNATFNIVSVSEY